MLPQIRSLASGEDGMSLLQVIFMSSFVALFGYIVFTFSQQYRDDSRKLTERMTYREIGKSRAQTLPDPLIIMDAMPLRTNDLQN